MPRGAAPGATSGEEQPGRSGREAGEKPTSRHRAAAGAYAQELGKLAEETARRRSPVEARWIRNARQYYGRYDQETEAKLAENPGSSRLFVNMTRPKTKVMRSRITDILLPLNDSNWTIEPTPVPEMDHLAATDISPMKGYIKDYENLKASGETMTAEQDESYADAQIAERAAMAAMEDREIARQKAEAMRLEMQDQLEECGYAQVVKASIDQACKLGSGIMKGPFTDVIPGRRWRQSMETGSDGKKKPIWSLDRASPARKGLPAYQWVDCWNFYPDMEAVSLQDCEFCFQLHRLSRTELKRLARSPAYDGGAIREILKQKPAQETHFSQNARRRDDLRETDRGIEEGRYNVLEYHGPVKWKSLSEMAKAHDRGDLLAALGRSADMTDLHDSSDGGSDPLEDRVGIVWFCQGVVLRYDVNPFESEELPYSAFSLDPADTGIFGYGIPSMIEDQQSALNAAWRLLMQNAALSGLPMFEVDDSALRPADRGNYEIKAGKVWVRRGGDPRADAIKPIPITPHSKDFVEIANLARGFMDDESSLPLIAQGEQASHTQQTAHGMSLLANAVNLIFRNVTVSFDNSMTIPNIRRLYDWNMQFSEREDIKGDMRPKARGASVLLVRDLQAQNLLMLLNLAFANPAFAKLLRVPWVARRLFEALQIPRDEAVLTDIEIRQAMEAEAQTPPKPDPESMIKLQMKEIEVQSKVKIAEMERETEIVKLANQRRMSISKIQSDLRLFREKAESDEERDRMKIKSQEKIEAARLDVKEDEIKSREKVEKSKAAAARASAASQPSQTGRAGQAGQSKQEGQ